jgi:hypothetical protein
MPAVVILGVLSVVGRLTAAKMQSKEALNIIAAKRARLKKSI